MEKIHIETIAFYLQDHFQNQKWFHSVGCAEDELIIYCSSRMPKEIKVFVDLLEKYGYRNYNVKFEIIGKVKPLNTPD